MASSPSAPTVLVQQRGPCLTLTLSAPETKNALSASMIAALRDALDAAAENPDVRVLVLTGSGGTFCAGADLKGLKARDTLTRDAAFPALLERFTTLGKPTIARIEGHALGGGLGLVASCDVAVAAESAFFGTPEIRRGFFPMMIMAVLSRVVPRRKLLPMMLLGETFSAQEALALNLVSEVVADGALDARVGALADKLASQSPTAMRLGLLAYHRQADQPLSQALEGLRQDLATLIASPDGQEGVRAFLEKRAPIWSGRGE